MVPVINVCKKAIYRKWVRADSGGTIYTNIKNNTAVCITHPYNVRLRLKCPVGSVPELPVTIKLLNHRRRVIRKQVEVKQPFLLWGDANQTKPGAINLASPRQLRNGIYYLTSKIGGEIKFTQQC
jgi:hypothetical protein